MVDFDGLVNAKVNEVFGEIAQTGKAVLYTPQGGTPFNLDGVFDEAWKEIDIKFGRHGSSAPLSTTKPVFGVRLSDFPYGVEPKQNDTLVRYQVLTDQSGNPLTDENGNTLYSETKYQVSDVSPDGIRGSGWMLLSLN